MKSRLALVMKGGRPAMVTRASSGDAAACGGDSTRAQLARRSESRSPRLKSPEASADGGGVVGTDRSIGLTGADVDDTGSVHSGGSMAGNTGGPVSETGPAMRLAAARVELEGGYVAFVVSDELLPADVRRSVAATVGGAAASSGGDAAGAGGDFSLLAAKVVGVAEPKGKRKSAGASKPEDMIVRFQCDGEDEAVSMAVGAFREHCKSLGMEK